MTATGQARIEPSDSPRAVATETVRTLRQAGHVAYFAGGCVRDELLGLVPQDYDVATDATPDRIRSLFRRTEEVGAAFGVVLVKQSGHAVEVATFRADGPYSDRRRPDSITFSDARADAARRDFTINALFLDPLVDASAAGRVIDYVGGVADLKARIVRAVGDAEARLAEDHLRALRAVRFAARLGFELEPETAAAIRAHARELGGVSRERIGDEMRRMLSHPTRARAAELLQMLGLDGPALGETGWAGDVATLKGLALSLAEQAVWSSAAEDVFVAALAAWALDRSGLDIKVAAARARAWRPALCLSNDEWAGLAGTLETLESLRQGLERATVARQRRLGASAWGRLAWRVLRGVEPEKAREWADVWTRQSQLAEGLAPAALVDGMDLIAAGWKPGPRFREALDHLYDAQLEGRVSNRAEALELIRTMGVQP